jgi:hypothetical protein
MPLYFCFVRHPVPGIFPHWGSGMRISIRSCAALAAVVVVAVLGLASQSEAQTTAGGTWGTALTVDVAAALPAGATLQSEEMNGVSCASAGNCSAIGSYESYTTSDTDLTDYPFVVSETDGTWGTPTAVSGIEGIAYAAPAHISCAAAGDCGAVWGNGTKTYVIDESGGVWGAAQQVTVGTVETELTGINCPAAGDCTAVGDYTDAAGSGLPFVMDSTDGTWDTPQELLGAADLSSPSPTSVSFASVSCSSVGNCAADGSFRYSDGQQPYLAVETDGTWGNAQLVAGMASLNGTAAAGTMVSCGSDGDCAATGLYAVSAHDQTWVAYESGGTWSSATQLATPPNSGASRPESVSCSAQGYCAVAAAYMSSTTDQYIAYAATSSGDNDWTASALPGVGTDESEVYGASCPASDYCTVAGYNFSLGETFFSNDVSGTWTAAQPLSGVGTGFSEVAGISCASVGYCTAVGEGLNDPFTVSEATPATLTLAESASKVTYGDEQAEKFTATVTSADGGTPTGTVTVVDANTDICRITLSGGTGTCTLPTTVLRSDATTQLTATYSGDATYIAADATASLNIATASTTTSVTLSKTSVTYGSKYQTEAEVTVKPEYSGTPTGVVAVYGNGGLLCVATISDGKGECGVPDGLNAARYKVTASYDGDSNFNTSNSAATYLTVAKASSATTLTLSKTTITRGHENAEKLTVKVSSPATGYATGKVTIKAGSTTVCVITLKDGTGSCTLSSSKLKAGSYKVVASYAGDTNHNSSNSATKALKVDA